MGYDVHITRAEEWSESDENPISAEEWHAYASSDPTLSREGPFSTDSPHFYNWRVGDTETWLEWFQGAIYTKNPTQHVREAMFAIATHFDARVQGDEGEYYGQNGKVIRDEYSDEEGRPRPETSTAEEWTKEEIASFIEELEQMKRRGELDTFLGSFEHALVAFPDQIERYIKAMPEFRARGHSRFSLARRLGRKDRKRPR